MNKTIFGQWSVDQAVAWHDAQPWMLGFNGYPSNCVNRTAMWQKHRHDEVFAQIAREFDLARETGFNAVRALVQFEVWRDERAAFLAHLDEYLDLAASRGLRVMLCLGNDCCPPRARYRHALGEQSVEWGYHSGTKASPHSGDYREPGWQPLDDPAQVPLYDEMADELAARHAHDPRIQVWDVWNEIGNSNRGVLSLPAMRRFFEILRARNVDQPLTADVWRLWPGRAEFSPEESEAFDLSDIVTFHCYSAFPDFVRTVEWLRTQTARPLVCNEWLNRIEGNTVETVLPFLHAMKIGSFHWGLIQGFSQTYEPHGAYFESAKRGERKDLRLWMHDLYRFNGFPYDWREIDLIRAFAPPREGNASFNPS